MKITEAEEAWKMHAKEFGIKKHKGLKTLFERKYSVETLRLTYMIGFGEGAVQATTKYRDILAERIKELEGKRKTGTVRYDVEDVLRKD